jgi:hypothetical protein
MAINPTRTSSASYHPVPVQQQTVSKQVTTIRRGVIVTPTDVRAQSAADRSLAAMQASDSRRKQTIQETQRNVEELMTQGVAQTLAAGYETIRLLEEELALVKANRRSAQIAREAEFAELQRREKELSFNMDMSNGWLDSAKYFVDGANKKICESMRAVSTHDHCFMTSLQRGMECAGPLWR